MDLKLPSSIDSIFVDGREFLIKRDDLVDPLLSGNKFRKLYALIKTPPQTYNHIISYGGTQSNAMLSLAALCNYKGWRFTYYTKPLSSTQKSLTYGNFYEAKKLGMNHIEIPLEYYKDFIASIRLNLDIKSFIVDQGGAIQEANIGLEALAQEIREANLDVKSLATPSGTGTTALFLALNLPEYKVYTTPCVGSATYLREQLSALSHIPPNLIILESKRSYHFAKVYREFYEMYQKLLLSKIEFDLVYAPALWINLLEQTDEKILYIHSGGVGGNITLLQRYKQKNII